MGSFSIREDEFFVVIKGIRPFCILSCFDIYMTFEVSMSRSVVDNVDGSVASSFVKSLDMQIFGLAQASLLRRQEIARSSGPS